MLCRLRYMGRAPLRCCSGLGYHSSRAFGNLEKSAQKRVDTWGGDRSENKDKRVDLVPSTGGQRGFTCSVSSLKAKRWESYKRKTSAH